MTMLLAVIASIVWSQDPCPTTKEFIATRNFIIDQPKWKLTEVQIVDLATQVAKGCDGAAKRFINGIRVFQEVELAPKDSLVLAIELARSSEVRAKSFLKILQICYLEKYLDLDVASSLRIARELTLTPVETFPFREDDYSSLANFFIDLGLARPLAAKISYDLSILAANWQEAIYPHFLKTWSCATSMTQTPNHTDTLRVVKEVLENGPIGSTNFCDALKYGTAPEGMNLDNAAAFRFALNLAKLLSTENVSVDPKNRPADPEGRPKKDTAQSSELKTKAPELEVRVKKTN